MRRALLALVCMFASPFYLEAQITRNATQMVPSGKGHGIPAPEDTPSDDTALSYSATSGNGIAYHGGPVMLGGVKIYFIWYGNWTNGSQPSDSQTTVNLINALYGSGGAGGSGYALITSSYGDASHSVAGKFALARSTTNNYSGGKSLSDSAVQKIVSGAISSKALPKDANGLYFVLTSSDVRETSGFCSQYCGWHDHFRLSGSDIKYAFVGNPDRCPYSCEAQVTSPNDNSGADGMASAMVHETVEALSDPDLNAWYDSAGNENADKCAWKFGPTIGTIGNAAYNQTFGGKTWLIQMNWENTRKGGCAQTKGGIFYNH
jgi:hypothetical protein